MGRTAHANYIEAAQAVLQELGGGPISTKTLVAAAQERGAGRRWEVGVPQLLSQGARVRPVRHKRSGSDQSDRRERRTGSRGARNGSSCTGSRSSPGRRAPGRDSFSWSHPRWWQLRHAGLGEGHEDLPGLPAAKVDCSRW